MFSKLRLTIFFFFLFFHHLVFSQSEFENWNTLDVSGKVNKKLELKLEYRNKYNHQDNRLRSSHVDMGMTYSINSLSIGAFYREIYEIESEKRVTELRPHLDLFYRINDNLKIRLRNEYRIKELSDNVFRYRMRLAYSFKIWDNSNPFIQNEIFISEKKLVRDRVNIGLSIKIKKTPFRIKPSYILESNRKESKIQENSFLWTYRNVFSIACNIRF
tara:strand:- start:47 stop:694 length:648 start_codon:yes stop_codon:yes gene_type:complete